MILEARASELTGIFSGEKVVHPVVLVEIEDIYTSAWRAFHSCRGKSSIKLCFESRGKSTRTTGEEEEEKFGVNKRALNYTVTSQNTVHGANKNEKKNVYNKI